MDIVYKKKIVYENMSLSFEYLSSLISPLFYLDSCGKLLLT